MAGLEMKRLTPLILAALCGCGTSSIYLRYQPQGPAMSLNGPKARLLLSVQDKAQGVRGSGAIGWTGALSETIPMDEAVKEGLVAEFKRLGMPLTASRQDADGLLEVAITQAMVSAPAGGFHNPFNATLGITVVLRSLDQKVLWMGDVVGRAQIMGATGGYSGGKPNRVMNLAFNDLMGKIGPLFEAEGLTALIFNGPAAAAGSRPAAPVRPAQVLSDVDDLPRDASRRRGYAVVFGIERYRASLPPADWAAADARLVGKYAAAVLGFPPENVVVLTDESATKSDFEKYFERWLPNRVDQADEVFVYFSGHGAPNTTKGDAYLVPYDGDPTYIEQTGYSLKRMFDSLGRLPAKKVYVAMDSCFSGAGGRSVMAAGARPLVAVAEAPAPSNVTVLSASAGDQISNSYPEKGHGLFTYYLLKGMKQKGADMKAVYDFLRPEVLRAARQQYNSDQEPQWRAGQ